MNPEPGLWKERLRAEALRLGFDAFGVAPVDAALRREYYQGWLAAGNHGEMHWLERNNTRRLEPARLLADGEGAGVARSLVLVGLNYHQTEPPRRYRIAQYALGRDYHNVMRKRLRKIAAVARTLDHGGRTLAYVDTGPVLEKVLAAQAGLGWQGKHTVLIHPEFGTWLALGVVVTSLALPADAPGRDRCGSCNACLTACPTQAITAPYQLDARRCLAYLLIEHPGAIPEEFRAAVGNRLFGCDECLDVCPWNKWARATHEASLAPRDFPDVREMLEWGEAEFSTKTHGSPLARLKLARLQRNACVVLGNIGTQADLPALTRAAHGADPLVAEHAAWAIKRIHARVSGHESQPESGAATAYSSTGDARNPALSG